MAEYIEREAVMQKFADHVKRSNNSDFAPAPTWNQAVQIVEDSPAVDARPVVLCRDCKHNMANIPDIQDGMNINENWNACQLTELYDSVKPDDFCSHGVKREENK